MTRDEVIRLAREAGLQLDKHNGGFANQSELVRFAALIAAQEREACAKVCEEYDTPRSDNYAGLCADAIRARGKE